MGKIEGSRYDTSLQMFVDTVKEPKLGRLVFTRWMVENDKLGRERPVAGPVGGDFALLAGLDNSENEIRKGKANNSLVDIRRNKQVASDIDEVFEKLGEDPQSKVLRSIQKVVFRPII